MAESDRRTLRFEITDETGEVEVWELPAETEVSDLAAAQERIALLERLLVEHHRVGYALQWGKRCPICEEML